MAQTGVLSEASTLPGKSLLEDLFLELPRDSRFNQVVLQKIPPSTGLDANSSQINFQLPSLDTPNVYLIQNTTLEVNILITKADGTVPPKTAKVCAVNNTLSSLFSSVSMTINDALVTTSSTNYAYKDYLMSLLSYSTDAKNMFSLKGWYLNSPPEFTGVDNNSVYHMQTSMFRKDRKSEEEFKPEGTILMGRLYHDIMSAQGPNLKTNFYIYIFCNKNFQGIT